MSHDFGGIFLCIHYRATQQKATVVRAISLSINNLRILPDVRAMQAKQSSNWVSISYASPYLQHIEKAVKEIFLDGFCSA